MIFSFSNSASKVNNFQFIAFEKQKIEKENIKKSTTI